MFTLFRDEALAYMRLGLLAPGGRRVVRRDRGKADVGVLFVPGVGANGSQFWSMRQALAEQAQWFDAFEYSWLADPRRLAEQLHGAIERVGDRCDYLVVVGHSLGGFLSRLVLQGDAPPKRVAGFAAICSPLHGTWRSKLAPSSGLRSLRPDSPLMQEVVRTSHRLKRLDGALLSVAARRDQFIQPYDSALLPGAEQLLLEDVAHAGSLFDPRVHRGVADLVERVRAKVAGQACAVDAVDAASGG